MYYAVSVIIIVIYAVHIGLTDAVQNRVWRWADDSPLTYTNWAPGQPDGADAERCSALQLTRLSSGVSSAHWLDVPCGALDSSLYICEIFLVSGNLSYVIV